MRRVHTLPVAAIVVLVGLIQVSSVLGLQPAADDGIATVFEDEAVTITLSGSDPTDADLQFDIVDGPADGSLDEIQAPECSALDVCTADVTYTPDQDFSGSDSFTFTTSHGAEFSSAGTIDITVTPVNDVPSFTKGLDQTVNEDAGAQTVLDWATAISAGPANESSQVLSFIVSNDNTALFSSQPAVSASGTLTYTPAANANGSATVSVQIHDNGGTADGGQNTSATQTFLITVTAVNDVPSFTKGPDQLVNEDSGPHSVAWVSSISAGPSNEGGQALNFIVSNDNNALFSTQPAVAANGTLTYALTSNASGSATVTVSLHDNGGAANGGDDTSATQTAEITVTPVNDVPSFTKGLDQTVNEDAGAQTVAGWATDLSAGPANESSQVLSFIVSNDNTALFSSQPAVSASGTLTYTPAANANGSATVSVQIHDNGGTADGGQNTSATQTFLITVTAVNDVPSFTKGPDQLVNEDSGPHSVAWASSISAGPSNEGGQALNFIVSNDNNALFSTQPAVAANGTLTYALTSNASGSATVTVSLHDNGGAANGGDDTSATQTAEITVNAVNDAPSFAIGADQTVNEDTSSHTANGWITGISPGPSDEMGQTVSFTVTNTNTGLFSTQPAVAANGTLSYVLAADAFGTATLSVTAHDSASGMSTAQDADIIVSPVNDVPSFTKGGDQTDLEDPGAQTVVGWATAILAGPANESGQVVDFILTNNNNALFLAQPAVAANGTLTYTLALNANGSATVSVAIHDNGGTANSGVNTSATQTFTITVTPVNDAPTFTKGANQTDLEDAGAQTVPGWATVISAGAANESGQVLSFTVTNDNNALFLVQPAITVAGQLTYTPAVNANGSATVSVTLHDNGGTTNGGLDASAIQTFTITVTAVNDVPSFTKGGDESDLEDPGAQTVVGWATAILAGPANESGQVVDFILTNNNNALFLAQPAVAANGTLTYTLALNANGSATVSVAIHDNGGTANSGVNTSATQTFTITVTPVNDAPTFTKGANQTDLEDAGAQTVPGWATVISAGAANESGQVLSFTVTNDNNALFLVQPAITVAGQLTYTPAVNANGSATVSVTLHDNGGTTNGGLDASAIQTFTITVTAVNDVPSFTKGGDESVPESASPPMFTRVAWATNISAGPADEASQTLAFTLTTDKDSLFAVKPAIDPSGTLTYRPKANTSGTALVTVTLKDNGGIANGGVDTSPSQQFTIDVEGTNNAPAASSDHPSMPEGAGATSINVLANDQDLDGDTMTIVQVKCGSTTSSTSCSTAHGTAAIAGGGTSVTFKPAALFDGSDTFQYTISDGNGGSSSATVFVTVTKDTTAPVAKAPSGAKSSSVSGAAKTVPVTITWPATTDAGSGIAKYELQQSINGGTWTNVTLSSATARSVTRTLTFGTTYRFRVRATDGEGNVGSWVEGRAFTPLKVTRGTSG